MEGLLGYGTSSDSDEEQDGDQSIQGENASGGDCGAEVKKVRNFLLESGSESSESDSASDSDSQTAPDVLEKSVLSPCGSPPPCVGRRLPPPPSAVLSGSSVFTNPFREQAVERLSVLQKHVPLTLEARPSQIGGRKMCVSYRRDSRCRFGSSCKFAHDSDLQSPAPSGSSAPSPHSLPSSCTSTAQQDSAGPQEGSGRKRRVGVSDSLTPPKKALRQYDLQRKKESVTPFT
ncbi:hypothetical protein GN956_G12442 [Arapaima gigas]